MCHYYVVITKHTVWIFFENCMKIVCMCACARARAEWFETNDFHLWKIIFLSEFWDVFCFAKLNFWSIIKNTLLITGRIYKIGKDGAILSVAGVDKRSADRSKHFHVYMYTFMHKMRVVQSVRKFDDKNIGDTF